MSKSRIGAILGGTVAAAFAVSFSYVVLGLCLAQPLEDLRPSLAPVANLGAAAILFAIAIASFRLVFRGLYEHRGRRKSDDSP
jgi:hypothetical protein